MESKILPDGRSVLVAAVDLSEASKSVFDAALRIATDARHSEIHLLHVRKGGQARAGEAIAALTTWAEQLPEAGARIELHATESANVADAIVEFAAQVNADVILIGTHGRTGVARLMTGSVAEVVVRTAGCSVFIVRPKKHEVSRTPRGDR